MGAIEVTAKKGDKACAVPYDFGDDLKGMIAKYSDEVVFSNARANMKIVLQAGLRRCLEHDKDPHEFASRFIPGVVTAAAAVDPVVAMKAKFATMDDTEKAQFLKDLKAGK